MLFQFYKTTFRQTEDLSLFPKQLVLSQQQKMVLTYAYRRNQLLQQKKFTTEAAAFHICGFKKFQE